MPEYEQNKKSWQPNNQIIRCATRNIFSDRPIIYLFIGCAILRAFDPDG